MRGGVVADASESAARTAVLCVGSRMCSWGSGSQRRIVDVFVGLRILALDRGCVRGAADLSVGSRMCSWGCGSQRRIADVHVGPLTGVLNPFLRSWALLVAVWAACPGRHLWG